MRKKISFVITAVAIALLLFLLIALRTDIFKTRDSSARKIYFADNISEAHQVVIDRFNELHRGSIEVVPVNLPFDKFTTNERKELLARSLRNKSDRIDIFAVDLIWGSRFSKWSEPLDRYFTKAEIETNLHYALESCYSDSILVAIPLYLDIGLMYYRRDLLQKLPHWQGVEERLKESMTWTEFIALRDKLGYLDKPFYAFPAKDFEGLLCNYFELFVGQTGKALPGNTVDLAAPEAAIALRMMVDFVHRSGVSPKEVVDFDENRSYDFMLKHDGMFWRGWPNFLESYAVSYSDKQKIHNIGRAALPHFEGKKPRSVFGGWNLMISKYSASKPEAIEFLKYLQSEAAQKTLFDVGGYLPTNRKLYEDTTFMRAHTNLTYYRTLLDRGFHRPSFEEYTRISDIISSYFHRAIKGEISVNEALVHAAQKVRTANVSAE
jgi:multiple sugar transport system substrate-binding protein